MNFPLTFLALVFLFIAVRQVGSVRLPIWAIMLSGAIGVLLSGDITQHEARHSINVEVMLFLGGMFLVGNALEESGYLAHLFHDLFRHAGSATMLLLLIICGFGLLSALLMNDTIAIIGTPLMLMLARQHSINPKPLLLALAFAVTTGSVMSPIGNPQNLLIALGSGLENPFLTFGIYLLLPTVASLMVTFVLLKLSYKKHFTQQKLEHSREPLRDERLAVIAKYALIFVILLTALKIVLTLVKSDVAFPLTWIALIPALPLLLFSKRRWELLKGIDWQTLIFFAAMFVLMQSVWQTGFFQATGLFAQAETGGIPGILALSRSSPYKKTITRYSTIKRTESQLPSTGYKRINSIARV